MNTTPPNPVSAPTLTLLAIVLMFGGTLDIKLIFFLGCFRHWKALQEVLTLFNDDVFIHFIKGGILLFAIFQIVRQARSLQARNNLSNDFPAIPMLFPCQTSHTRLFPKKHGFSYSYLLAGIPVGWKGSVGGILSVDNSKKSVPWYSRWLSFKPGNSWYIVEGKDYLHRGNAPNGLQGKLQDYLQSQGVNYYDYPYAYLLTAPRFLGYSSNPVSIWNLYSAEKELTALILEVNNTFDERHIYFLKSIGDANRNTRDYPHPKQEPELNSRPPRFTNTWPKEFYVSVFNSRDGSYSLATYDPLFPGMAGKGPVDTTITLNSSKHQRPMLVARIVSTAQAVDPEFMSVWRKLRFLATWWWVGFATFPRTVKEAFILLFKRKMKWVFRPEPFSRTLPRHADPTEKFLESAFRSYLRHKVGSAVEPVTVRYTPAGILDASGEVMRSPAADIIKGGASTGDIEFTVLTPLFYSRFVRYEDDLDAFTSEFHQNATIFLSDPDMLANIVVKQSQTAAKDYMINGRLEKVRFRALQSLRNRPAPTESAREADKECGGTRAQLLHPQRCPGPSGIERYVLAHLDSNERTTYFKWVVQLYISDYLSFGWLDILEMEIFLVRCVVAWIAAGALLMRPSW